METKTELTRIPSAEKAVKKDGLPAGEADANTTSRKRPGLSSQTIDALISQSVISIIQMLVILDQLSNFGDLAMKLPKNLNRSLPG